MKYFKNTSWLLGEKIIRMAVGLFVGIWVARYLGPEQFGVFSYAQAFVGLFAAIATLGLDGIVVRELVNSESHIYDIIGTTFWLKVMGALASIFILAIAINFTSNDIQENILIFIIASATIFQSFNVVDMYFQAKVLSKYIVYVNIASLFISSVIKVTLILNNAPLISFAWVVLLDALIMAVGFSYLYIQNNKVFSIKNLSFTKKIAVDLLQNSWPLIISGIIISIYMRIDQIMIKEMLDAEAVGQYAAAVRLSEGWYFIPMAITSSLFPAIINAKKQNEEFYYARLQKLYDLMTWIAIAIALPMTFLSDWVVELLFGGKYNQAGSILIIHIWASVFVFLGVASSKWFINENLQKYEFYKTLAGGLINILLNYFFISFYGISGAAVATLISQAVASYLFNITNKNLRHTFLLQTNSMLLPFRKLGVRFK